MYMFDKNKHAKPKTKHKTVLHKYLNLQIVLYKYIIHILTVEYIRVKIIGFELKKSDKYLNIPSSFSYFHSLTTLHFILFTRRDDITHTGRVSFF